MSVVFETDRLILRHLEPGDFASIHAMFNDPEVVRFATDMPRDEEFTRAWLQARIASYAENGLGFWALIRKDSGDYIGHAGLLAQEVEGKAETEIGYWLRREDWGKGYATEAAVGCREHGFEVLGKQRLVSLIVPTRRGARRHAARAAGDVA